ncbi:MAG: cadmium-translocating P-type ATPase [Clostridia bacterium]|jgi:Cd2+/Zn2+-exporting ATPase|nr:cadmium-translocating P-type ATPase [Clostridia bacterium]
MKKKVRIEGLDCPNCARSLEIEINKLESVKWAKLDFLKSSLEFDCDNFQTAIEDIEKVTKELEPDAKLIKNDEKSNKKAFKSLILDLFTLFLGITIGIIIFFVRMPTWSYWLLYSLSALALGYKTYYKAVRLLFKGIVNENLLITISVIGASIVSEHMEGLMVIALYSIGKIFEGLAVDKSRRSIEALAKIQPEFAVVVDENGNEQKLAPEEVEKGSIIIVKPGEKVAIDGIIIDGECDFNMQSLTGESLPVKLGYGQEVLSGAIALNGVVKIKTSQSYSNSTISKIMELVEHASQNKSKTETFISKLTKYYTLGIIALSLIVWAIVWAVTKDFNSAIYRGLIFLVISCPCAFAISVPLTYFSGLGNASKNGILIKGSNYLDACAKIKIMAFDKTGTLTSGQFKIDKIISYSQNISEDDLLEIAAKGEQFSIHPLAKAIVSEAEKLESFSKNNENIENLKEIGGKGIEFSLSGKNYFVGRQNNNEIETVVEIYENDIKLGEIVLSDLIKPTSKEAIARLKKQGIKTLLLSGDNKGSVERVSRQLEIDQSHFGLLPQDKYNLIESLKNGKDTVGYVGDGINDAPSLTLCDVGFSMGINGSPASIEASDIVLVDDNPQKIASAIKISKFTKKIVLENIILSAAIKVIFLVLGSVGITGMLSAVFADVGVTLIAIFNSLRALKHKIN